MIVAIMAGVAMWGLFHAIGALWGGSDEFGLARYPRDLRRGLILLACVAAFLGWWLLLMRHHTRRKSRLSLRKSASAHDNARADPRSIP